MEQMEMTEGTAKQLVSILTSLNGTLEKLATALNPDNAERTQHQLDRIATALQDMAGKGRL